MSKKHKAMLIAGDRIAFRTVREAKILVRAGLAELVSHQPYTIKIIESGAEIIFNTLVPKDTPDFKAQVITQHDVSRGRLMGRINPVYLECRRLRAELDRTPPPRPLVPAPQLPV